VSQQPGGSRARDGRSRSPPPNPVRARSRPPMLFAFGVYTFAGHRAQHGASVYTFGFGTLHPVKIAHPLLAGSDGV
jgi:hypothetical protein